MTTAAQVGSLFLPSPMQPTSDLWPPLQEFLAAVEDRMEAVLPMPAFAPRSDAEDLYRASRHLCFSGGKRARPQLCAFFGEAIGVAPAAMVDVATAAELMHAASLLHDDVIDEGHERRGRPTANTVFGNLTAVLGGDVLFSLSLSVLRTCPSDVFFGAVDVLQVMTKAASDEAHARGNARFAMSQWREMAAGKTGALFGWCGSAAAHLSGDAALAQRLWLAGEHLGVAFQIADDLKDLLGCPGKERFQDLANQNPSWPLLEAVRCGHPLGAEVEVLWAKRSVDAAEAAAVGERFAASDLVGRGVGALGREVDQAVEALGALGTQVGGELIVAWARSLAAEFSHLDIDGAKR